jgi:cytochrome c biogenesis protein CcdA
MMMVLTFCGFAFLAGLLSTLSPCVLPIVPILLTSAANVHRRGPIALATGLAVSYVSIGTLLARSGRVLGLNSKSLHIIGAAFLALFALVMLSSRLQQIYAIATAGLSRAGNRLLGHVNVNGIYGQFVVGLVLGMIWSPCIGPTLGAALVAASQGKHVANSAMLMTLFSFGATSPLLILAYLSRSTILRLGGDLQRVAGAGKRLFGSALLVIAIAALSGKDRQAEGWLVRHSPAWLTALTTRF